MTPRRLEGSSWTGVALLVQRLVECIYFVERPAAEASGSKASADAILEVAATSEVEPT